MSQGRDLSTACRLGAPALGDGRLLAASAHPPRGARVDGRARTPVPLEHPVTGVGGRDTIPCSCFIELSALLRSCADSLGDGAELWGGWRSFLSGHGCFQSPGGTRMCFPGRVSWRSPEHPGQAGGLSCLWPEAGWHLQRMLFQQQLARSFPSLESRLPTPVSVGCGGDACASREGPGGLPLPRVWLQLFARLLWTCLFTAAHFTGGTGRGLPRSL